MLSNIVSLKKNVIVSGSHGKTTTSLVSKNFNGVEIRSNDN